MSTIKGYFKEKSLMNNLSFRERAAIITTLGAALFMRSISINQKSIE
jgi:hypothetical protein